MEIELIEIRDFLSHHSPFDVLPATVLNNLPRQLSIRYLRRGSQFPPDDSDDNYLYIIRSGAIELRNENDDLRDKLAEGDVFSESCLNFQKPEKLTGVTSEDSLLYLLSCDKLHQIRSNYEEFDNHFNQSFRTRLKHITKNKHDSTVCDLHTLSIDAGDTITITPITIDSNCSIRETAELMMQNNISSILVMKNTELIGLVTDRDLRNRCIAAGLSVDEPIHKIMTTELHTLRHNQLLSEALLMMTRLNVSHLPILKDKQLIGMLAMSDLIRHQSSNSAYITTDIIRAKNIDDLKQVSARIPELQLQLSNSSATARHIGEAISCITDAVTNKLIELAEDKLGPAPVPYVWLASGSQARREQFSNSDQDNALLISDNMTEENDDYFTSLAKFVSDGLDRCGYYYCPGDAMASNKTWRQPMRVWKDYFTNWIDRPEPKALMLSSIFFDIRPIAGDTSLFTSLQEQILNKTKANKIFIAYMVSNALKHRPPLGFFRNFVLIHGGEHDDMLDIKHRGIVPIVDIARVFALLEGITEANTQERLRIAIDTGALSEEMGENLMDGLEFISTLRVEHQANQIRSGLVADNYISPDNLSDLERKYLKRAFREIQLMQETLANRYQAERFV